MWDDAEFTGKKCKYLCKLFIYLNMSGFVPTAEGTFRTSKTFYFCFMFILKIHLTIFSYCFFKIVPILIILFLFIYNVCLCLLSPIPLFYTPYLAVFYPITLYSTLVNLILLFCNLNNFMYYA